ncbi:MAG: cytochrome c-type biogenesis protein [Pseudomonadota bacterium]
MHPDWKTLLVCDRRQMMRTGLSLSVLRAGAAAASTLAAAALAADNTPALATPMAADPVLEARVMKVAEELRCLVCQNETLAASQADLAVDLRKQIRLKLQQGQSSEQIVDFMVARYGEFVRYRPSFTGMTVLLWLGPFAFLLASLTGLAVVIRRRRAAPPAALSEAQRARARALLEAVEVVPATASSAAVSPATASPPSSSPPSST